MLDHMILTVSNVERSLAFYEAALKPLNIKFFLPYKGEGDHPDLWGFGDGKRAFFWIKQGKPDPASIHWGFMAENNGKVDEFYRAAISAGARDNISPRARVEYYPEYYAADVFDPCLGAEILRFFHLSGATPESYLRTKWPCHKRRPEERTPGSLG